MAESVTPTRASGKLDSLPKDELIKYIKKQATQMKDLKKKNEDLNLMLKHEKDENEKLEQEQKSWLSRGISAEFEKKEELQKKERELQMAAHLGQQMLAENDKLRSKFNELEKENTSMKEEMAAEIGRLDAEKETMEQTLVMIQNEYKEAKLEAQKLKDALETAAAEHDKEYEKWEEERKELKDLTKNGKSEQSNELLSSRTDLSDINKALQQEIEELREQMKLLESGDDKLSDDITKENQELKAKLEANNVELKAQDESLKVLRNNCQGLQSKIEELHQLVNMVSAERDESNAYSKQMGEELKLMKEEREKMIRSLKSLKGKLEKATNLEEDLKGQLSALTTDKGELQIMVKNLQREKKTILQSNKKLKEKMRTSSSKQGSFEEGSSESSLEKENAELRKEIKLLKSKCENEEGELDSLKKNNVDIIKEKDELKEKVNSLMEKLLQKEQELNDKVVENEGERAMVVKLQSRVDELLSAMQSLNEEKMHQETEIEELFKTHDELQLKYDKECKEKMEKDQTIQQLQDELMNEKDKSMHLFEELSSSQIAAQASSLVVKSDNEVLESSENANKREIILQQEIEKKCDEVDRLTQQLMRIEEELEMERKQRKVVESNFDEKVSSVDEFEANEMRIASMNEECMEEIERLKRELDEAKKQKDVLETAESNDEKLKKEIEDFKSQLEEKEHEIKRTELSKEELVAKLNELSKEIQDKKTVVASINENIERLQKELKNSKHEKDELEKIVAVLKNDLEEKGKESVDFTEEIKMLKSNEKSLNDEIKELKTLVAGNQQDGNNEIEKYKKAYKKVKEKFNDVGNINEELKKELQAKAIIVEELRKELNDKNDESKKECDREKVEELLKVVDEKNKIIFELEAELKNYKDVENGKDLIKENDLLKEEIKKMGELQQKLDEYEIDRVNLNQEIKNLSQENVDVKAILMKENEMACELRSLIQKIDAEKLNLQNCLTESECKINELASEKEKTDVSLKEFEGLKDALKTKDQELLELKMLNEKSKDGKEELFATNKQLSEEKELIEKEIAILRNEIEKMTNLESEKASYILQMEHDLSNAKMKLNEYEMEMEKMEKEIIERDNEIKDKDIKIVNFEESNRQLEENLKSVAVDLEDEKQRCADVMKQNELLKSKKEELSTSLNEHVHKISFLEENKLEIERQLRAEAADSENADALAKEIKLLKEKCSQYEEMNLEIEKMQKECEEKDEEIENFNKSINEQEKKLEVLTKELSEVKTERENVMNSTEMETNRLSNVEDDLKTAYLKIDALENENKEKTEKMNKFKSVAIKAKKEIDSIKEKTSNEKRELDATIQNISMELQNVKEEFMQQSHEFLSLKEIHENLANEFDTSSSNLEKEAQRNIEADNEIKKLSTTIDHLQVSLASTENESSSLQAQLKEKEEAVMELTKKFDDSVNSVKQLQQQLTDERSDHDATKSELSKILGEFEIAKKDVNQMKMISLEMDDYHRTAQSLQKKLSESESECKDGYLRIQELENDVKTLNEKIAAADEKNTSACQEIEKLSSFLTQRDGEIKNLIAEKKDLEEKDLSLKQQIEEISATCEERMIQISEFASEKEKILQQLKNEKDLHKKNLQSVETKFSRTKTELSLLQEAYDNCKQEFESYKIRAQNVLKQQKMKHAENDDSQFLQEKLRLEKIIDELKEKLKDTSGRLSTCLAENEELETEQEKIHKKYNDLVKDISEKEAQWRGRLIEIQSEMKKQSIENEQKILVLSQQNDSLQAQLKNNEEYETMAQDYEETIKDLKEQIAGLRQSPKRQNSKGKKSTVDGDAKEPRSTPEHLTLRTENSSDSSHGLVERPGAEGMDSSELEAIDKSSLPATPLSADSASILDKILSPMEQQNPWPLSPTASKEEGFRLRSALTTAEKNVEHLTELLGETEGSNVRLTEQIKLLKAEIRRMQQNQEREEALHNLEYLKNVIIKFMKCSTTERECLVPVLSTMLKLTTEEKQFITEFAKGEADQGEDSGGWSSYVYKWTSFS